MSVLRIFDKRLICREKCCIDRLLYNEKCFYCRNIVRVIKIFDLRKCIKPQVMTEEEFCKYHAPVAFCSEGSVVMGLYPVMKRVILELILTTKGKEHLHGTERIKNPVINEGECCWICTCPMNIHCTYCRAPARTVATGIMIKKNI